jgi:hypothetical protein
MDPLPVLDSFEEFRKRRKAKSTTMNRWNRWSINRIRIAAGREMKPRNIWKEVAMNRIPVRLKIVFGLQLLLISAIGLAIVLGFVPNNQSRP